MRLLPLDDLYYFFATSLLLCRHASLIIMKVIMILRMLIMVSSMHGYSLLTGHAILDVNCLSVNELWNQFMMTIQEGINLFVPVYRHKSVKMQYPAYIKHLQNKKKYLWHRRHYHGCRAAYNKVNIKCRQAIKQFHVRRESELSTLDSKKFLLALARTQVSFFHSCYA
jgi:hypothetical protein